MRVTLIASTLLLAACQMPVADPPAETPAEDACGAAAFQHLVGARATAAEGMTAPGPVRVFRTGQPVTMDHRPDRLNIELDARGRTVVRVFCG
jgi:hypothetical protein